jgi:hypothetical protein
MGKPQALYLWADERLDGSLDDRLANWRADGVTIDGIVDKLRDLDLTISRETVRRWLRDRAIPEPSEQVG